MEVRGKDYQGFSNSLERGLTVNSFLFLISHYRIVEGVNPENNKHRAFQFAFDFCRLLFVKLFAQF